jgi:hypothetical protein
MHIFCAWWAAFARIPRPDQESGGSSEQASPTIMEGYPLAAFCGLVLARADDVITYSAYAQWNFVVAHHRPDSSWGWLLDANPATAIAQAADPNIFAPPVGGYAVRPQFDYDRNLNVLGDGPYVGGSQVQAWHGWSNASPNEVWVPLQRNGQPPAAVGA